MTDIISDLKEDEGWVPHVYQDSLGFWTLGYGFMVDPRKGGRIPEGVAEFWLRFLVHENRRRLLEREPFFADLPPGVQSAVENMAYQMGVSGVLGFRKMWAAMKRRDWGRAAAEALDSRWARQTNRRATRVADRIAAGK